MFHRGYTWWKWFLMSIPASFILAGMVAGTYAAFRACVARNKRLATTFTSFVWCGACAFGWEVVVVYVGRLTPRSRSGVVFPFAFFLPLAEFGAISDKVCVCHGSGRCAATPQHRTMRSSHSHPCWFRVPGENGSSCSVCCLCKRVVGRDSRLPGSLVVEAGTPCSNFGSPAAWGWVPALGTYTSRNPRHRGHGEQQGSTTQCANGQWQVLVACIVLFSQNKVLRCVCVPSTFIG